MNTKTFQISTDAGTVVLRAKSVRDALARCAHIPDDVRTAKAFAGWLRAHDGFGMMACDGVVLARVYCTGEVVI